MKTVSKHHQAYHKTNVPLFVQLAMYYYLFSCCVGMLCGAERKLK